MDTVSAGCNAIDTKGAMDLNSAADRATRVRGLYHDLERHHEGSTWELKDDMLGLVNDVGSLGRLVMATEGRWAPDGDVRQQLSRKLSECLWWILVLADRLDVDIDDSFAETMDSIEAHLMRSIDQAAG
jgi:NTP pyrophosphatase (non-canonical NTP hydrolase)